MSDNTESSEGSRARDEEDEVEEEGVVLDEDEEAMEDEVVNVWTSEHCMEDDESMQVVFVHGLKGSVLVDKDSGKCMWVKMRSVLRHAPEISNKADVCDVTFPGEKYHDMIATDTLNEVGGGIVHIYGPFVRAGQKRWKENFHCFVYDWRKDLVEIGKEFGQYLQKNILCYDPPRLLLVVHSMGGLVTWTLLSQLTRKMASEEGLSPIERRLVELLQRTRVLFIGTPFNPISAVIEDFTAGTQMHSFLTPARKVFTFPSAFQLMLGPRSDPKCAPLYDPNLWLNLRLSVFAEKKLTPQIIQDCVKAVPRMINYADNFRSNVLVPDFTGTPFEGLLTAVVTSKSWQTKSKLPDDFFEFTEKKGDNWMLDRWKGVTEEEGDHRVQYSNATSVPHGLKLTKIHLSKNEHDQLTSDFDVVFGAINELISL